MLDPHQFEQMVGEVTSAIADQTRPLGLMLADFPRLTNDGHARRMKAVAAGRGKGRVDLTATIKKFVRQRYPDFRFATTVGDCHRFEKTITDDLQLVLIFERIHHFGLGKAFTTHIGCESVSSDCAPLRCRHPLLSFFDRDSLEWTYGHRNELDACLDEVAILLEPIISRYETAWLSLRGDEDGTILRGMPNHGPLSFRDAADIAFRLICTVCPTFSRLNAAWFRQKGAPHSYFTPGSESRTAVVSGRLAPERSWDVRFADVEANRTVTVRVPYCGRIGYTLSNALSVNRGGVHHLLRSKMSPRENLMLPPSPSSFVQLDDPQSSLWREFADSPEVMQIAGGAGGNEFLVRNGNCSVVLQLNAELSDPPVRAETWHVHYLSKTPRTDLAINISARDRNITYRNAT